MATSNTAPAADAPNIQLPVYPQVGIVFHPEHSNVSRDEMYTIIDVSELDGAAVAQALNLRAGLLNAGTIHLAFVCQGTRMDAVFAGDVFPLSSGDYGKLAEMFKAGYAENAAKKSADDATATKATPVITASSDTKASPDTIVGSKPE